jgi:hypothetical protein
MTGAPCVGQSDPLLRHTWTYRLGGDWVGSLF